MRIGGRLAAAIEILEDIETRHRPASDALRDWGLSHRFAGSGDRAAIGNIVYDALRHRRSAAWLLDDASPRGLALGALLLEWGYDADTLDAELVDDRFAPSALSEKERAAIAEHFGKQPSDDIRSDVPEWCEPLLQKTYGDDWGKEGEAFSQRPPLDLRVNRLKSDTSKVLAALHGTGARKAAIAPFGIRIEKVEGRGRHPNVQAEPGFQKGWFEVQDEGSQIVAELATPDQPNQVLDYCAGAGGKTLSLSAAFDNKGQIFAHDAEKARLSPIFDRLKRAGARNVQAITAQPALDALENQMDLVLVDVPCTGSGTWRRRPDAKWRLTERQLEVRMSEQTQILDHVTRYVKPGGTLVYITCSIFREENQEQIEAFLTRHPDFVATDHHALWAKKFPHAKERAMVDAHGIMLSAATSGTDGFFFCAMTRN
ncbi:RsmB/NOP family class I SAM-dependent RNA methyltransferase [Limoniibacter endophyticus]|uniref:MFS transporter n=1 Tax=Limoniibacter endophyticus TaxID=1565040 RepID=A0A8J3GHD6_9HYPH|nr:RsmB/NOP family class I SAM-dependent RNA methyltransferase [Limoniibacter endophyticus]GHC70623.1 MFS transporter [Limoniibacter endophyticus]